LWQIREKIPETPLTCRASGEALRRVDLPKIILFEKTVPDEYDFFIQSMKDESSLFHEMMNAGHLWRAPRQIND